VQSKRQQNKHRSLGESKDSNSQHTAELQKRQTDAYLVILASAACELTLIK
jgi:hypothetical protein